MSDEGKIRDLIAAHFHKEPGCILPAMDFYSDLGADYLDLPELAMELEEAFGFPLNPMKVDSMRTVAELSAYVLGMAEASRNMRGRPLSSVREIVVSAAAF